MFLLKFIFLLFIFFIVVVVILGYSFLRQIYRNIKEFAGIDDRQGREKADTRYGSATNRAGRQSDGNVVIDHRNPNQANRKIIDDNEGEYVDYEE